MVILLIYFRVWGILNQLLKGCLEQLASESLESSDLQLRQQVTKVSRGAVEGAGMRDVESEMKGEMAKGRGRGSGKSRGWGR